jgi:hypothetical protein
LHSPNKISLDIGKVKFRGKETFCHIYQELKEHFGTYNLSEKELIGVVLHHWTDKKRFDSTIYKDMEAIILPELAELGIQRG